MLVLFHAMPAALALPCTPGDTACESANELRDRINALRPGAITDDHRVARRRTDAIRRRLDRIYSVAAAGGCTMDGLSAFTYDGATSAGDWNRGTASGTATSVYTSNVMSGSYTGDASGTFGDFGIYARNRFAAEWDADDAFIGGHVRVRGTTGVGYGVIGSCPSGVASTFVTYMPELVDLIDPLPADPAAGAGFLRVATPSAATGGSASSSSFRIDFAVGGARPPSSSATRSINPTLPVP